MTAAKKWSNEEDVRLSAHPCRIIVIHDVQANLQVALFRAIVSNTLASRSVLYTTPELAQWSKNGGDSINKKIQQLLKKLGSNIPGAGGSRRRTSRECGKGEESGYSYREG